MVKTSKNLFSKQKRSLRPSLSAGVIAIVLAGVHKGKKVIVLKQLGTGLLLVSGKTNISILNPRLCVGNLMQNGIGMSLLSSSRQGCKSKGFTGWHFLAMGILNALVNAAQNLHILIPGW